MTLKYIMKYLQLCRAVLLGLLAVLPCEAQAQFVAFNDFGPGFGTHTNATVYGSPGFAASGVLKNITNGLPAGVTLAVTNSGVVASATQGTPDYGTPASIVFDGYVDFGGTNNPGYEVAGASAILTYTFTGLNPNAEYNFQGTAIRGDATYTDRWTLFEIVGADYIQSRHTTGALTAGLATNQVAINTGANLAGDLAWWEHVRPGADGSFSVTSKQYQGAVPGGSSAGVKGYAMTGLRLEENGVYTDRTNLPIPVVNQAPNTINGIKTVFVIMMENHDWSTILGSPNCIYINNTLLPQASYCQQYYNPPGLHPSEPNYLWLVAGTNFGIRNDNWPATNHINSTNTLFFQLDRVGIPWKTYQEEITGNDVPDIDNYPYAVRHNPFVFFDAARTNLSYVTNHVRPYPELALDLTNNTVARFNFISPNVTNDMHDLTPGSSSSRIQGDNWLAREVPKILASPAYTNGGALFITFDEGTGTDDGPIALIALSPRAKGGGYNNTNHYDHSSLVRTWQDLFGLRPYLGAAAAANNLGDLFKTIHLTSSRWQGGAFSLTFTNVISGKTNWLQVSTNLAAGSWTTIRTNVATSSSLNFTNTGVGGTGHLFYRVLELP